MHKSRDQLHSTRPVPEKSLKGMLYQSRTEVMLVCSRREQWNENDDSEGGKKVVYVDCTGLSTESVSTSLTHLIPPGPCPVPAHIRYWINALSRIYGWLGTEHKRIDQGLWVGGQEGVQNWIEGVEFSFRHVELQVASWIPGMISRRQ